MGSLFPPLKPKSSGISFGISISVVERHLVMPTWAPEQAVAYNAIKKFFFPSGNRWGSKYFLHYGHEHKSNHFQLPQILLVYLTAKPFECRTSAYLDHDGSRTTSGLTVEEIIFPTGGLPTSLSPSVLRLLHRLYPSVAPSPSNPPEPP